MATERTGDTPACVLRLIELASEAWGGDKDAAQQLRLAGELLDLAGGAAALSQVQGLAHDHLLAHGGGPGRDLAGHLGDYWEHIPSWSAL
jgi:hypothetical protein